MIFSEKHMFIEKNIIYLKEKFMIVYVKKK
jgi:hypothetical protein